MHISHTLPVELVVDEQKFSVLVHTSNTNLSKAGTAAVSAAGKRRVANITFGSLHINSSAVAPPANAGGGKSNGNGNNTVVQQAFEGSGDWRGVFEGSFDLFEAVSLGGELAG
jgi:hypothetical protein